MSNVVEIKRESGNGAREALIDVLRDHRGYLTRSSDGEGCDVVLAQLWMRGFKVVPLDDTEGDPWHIPTMQRKHFEGWVQRRLWAIIDMPNGQFRVYEQTHDGVGPPTEYPSLRKAAARLLQLLGVGAVAPQTWPESICIGHVKTKSDDDSE
jgi:hypothetical protein